MKLPVGVCIFDQPPPNAGRTVSYSSYIREILAHFGLACSYIEPAAITDSLREVKVLVTVGEHAPDEPTQAALTAWLEAGGSWVSIAGVCGMPYLFGVEIEEPSFSCWGARRSTLGEGYAVAAASHLLVDHFIIPLHFFNGLPVHATGGHVLAAVVDQHQRETPRAAVVEQTRGSGTAILIAPDLPGTVVRIQQGIGVTRDGVSAPDGTGSRIDDVLKSGDGSVLDWSFDRQSVPGVGGLNVYTQPIADQWREVLMRAILYAAQKASCPVAILWFYPRNLTAVAHLSHDTDSNEPEKATILLDLLQEEHVNSTWCTILPGYPAEIMKRIAHDGHELAMHYDAMTPGTRWRKKEFRQQWRDLIRLFSGHKPVTNKNHYTRWEGDTEFFEWCENAGIKIDQSKGASKTGEAGYNFGTCHPYFPVHFDGELIDVLELCTVTQDFEVFAPTALLDVLLSATQRSHGVMHILFHPAHFHREEVRHAFRTTIRRARETGMEWWTAERLNDWTRARRQVVWKAKGARTGNRIELQVKTDLPEATVLAYHPDQNFSIDSGSGQFQVERWGFRFTGATVSLTKGMKLQFSIK